MVLDLDKYIAPIDAAKALGVKYPTLMARIDRGKIPTTRWGRFHLILRQDIGLSTKELQT
jgi:excisionase family DNA binding protein